MYVCGAASAALSATPGSNVSAMQEVVDALAIREIEGRSEDDPDIIK